MPFTELQFFDVFRRYNLETWPIPALLALGGAGLAFGIVTRRVPIRTIWWSLAALWAWMALGYHIAFFSAINPLAYAFALIFLIQATGFVVLARSSSTHQPPRVGRGRAVVGDLLFVYALLIYPLLGIAFGQRYPALPTFGLPCPTTIFTIAVLVRLDRSAPWPFYLIPLLWSCIAVVAAMRFQVVEDYVLLPVIVLGLVMRIVPVGAPKTPPLATRLVTRTG